MEIIKDKPSSLSVRDWITKKIALETLVPEHVIRCIISHQFDTAYECINKEGIHSLEISGFGKFYFNEGKAQKELQYAKKQKDAYEKVLNDSTATEEKRQKAGELIKSYKKNIEWLEKKLKK